MIICIFICIFIIYILLSISSNIDNNNDTNKIKNVGKILSINTFNKTKTITLNLFNDMYNQKEYIPVEDDDEIDTDIIVNEIYDDNITNKLNNIFNNIFNNDIFTISNDSIISINEINNMNFDPSNSYKLSSFESFKIKPNNIVLNDSEKKKINVN